MAFSFFHYSTTASHNPSNPHATTTFSKKRFLLVFLFLIASFFTTITTANPALAENLCDQATGQPGKYVESNVIGDSYSVTTGDGVTKNIRCAEIGESGDGIFNILAIALNVLTFGVGILATLGIAFSGLQYLTARDNDAQVAKAKMRILQIVIGLIVYAILWAALQFFVPGGIWGTEVNPT